ncbi:hypothetical protein V8G54_001371 [Vigna mungo]|uniref:Uncharacterized protein n=1 Tax=Vigna mungo TaxID=3915 RepID=A0AAQ3P8L5_VIGMU
MGSSKTTMFPKWNWPASLVKLPPSGAATIADVALPALFPLYMMSWKKRTKLLHGVYCLLLAEHEAMRSVKRIMRETFAPIRGRETTQDYSIANNTFWKLCVCEVLTQFYCPFIIILQFLENNCKIII